MSEHAQTIPAFVTRVGLYGCLIMSFEMNSASTFQKLMNKVIKGIEGWVVYIDDVVILSDDWNSHLEHLKESFRAVEEAGLVVNLIKCEFARAQINYLGNKIGLGHIAPKDANITAILHSPAPKNQEKIRKFLDMAGYYRRFTKNFSDVIYPLTELLKKQSKFTWDHKCQLSFDHLKGILTCSPILRSPNWDKPFTLAIDASDTGVCDDLFQENEAGTDHTISYYSKKLNEAEKKYATIEKETLSPILTLKPFEIYLSTSHVPIEIHTDHNPLVFLNRFRNKNQRLIRWSLCLQEWDLNIKHFLGKDNIIPDVLSRT